MLRTVEIRSSSSPQSKPHPPQNSEIHPFPLSCHGQIFVEGRLTTFWNNGKNRLTTNGSSLSYETASRFHSSQFLFLGSSNKSESVFLPVVKGRARTACRKTGSGNDTGSRSSRFLFPAISGSEKERKVTPSNRSFFTKPIYRQTSFQDGGSQVSMTIDNSQRLGCLHRSDGCISSFSDTSAIQKISSVRLRRSNISVHGLTLRNVPKSVEFHKINGSNSGALACVYVPYLFPYRDDWFIRDLIRNRLISHTKYCLQMTQNLGFILNLKKSVLIPAKKITFIGMEFLTQ